MTRRTAPLPVPSRRALLAAGTAVPAAALLAACGSDVSAQYGGDTGYVSGDGVAVEIPPADRAEPVDFTGTTYEDETFASSDVPPELLVINVWYAACAPCRIEAPHLAEISAEYAERGVQFVGVNTEDEAGPALAFEEGYGIEYPSLPDRTGEILYALRGQVAPNAVPSTVILDRTGRPAARISGAVDPSTLRSMLDSVLAEDA
jgi:thiol-disulfide isomerase/thioredoxin